MMILRGRASIVVGLCLLLWTSVYSFQVPQPAFFGRRPLVSPTVASQFSKDARVSLSLSSSSPSSNKEEDEDDSRSENSLYQPQPGERSDSTEPDVVQVNFDDMFQGMPTMKDIVADTTDATTGSVDGDYLAAGTESDSSKSTEPSTDGSSNDKDAWFAPIQQEIERKYADIKVKMKQELEEQRQADPESVPDNADLLMETVWQLEMEEEIQAERDKAAKTLLQEYESEGLLDTANRDLTGTEESEVAKKLQQEIKEEQEEREAQQARANEFQRYQRESAQKAAQKQVASPDENGDLDLWALERLEEMLSSTPEDDLEVVENLQSNIEQLRSKIDKEQNRGSIRPETLKEWQMYRAIATRMLEDEISDGTIDNKDAVEDEGAIAGRLESWKTYEAKERSVRSKSGLSRGPKMPFDWQEAPRSKTTIDADLPPPPVNDKRSRKEIRADVNQKSIEVLEGLLESSLGTPREASLRQNIEDLKAGLEEDLALEDEENFEDEKQATGPVDISDVFVRVDETNAPTVPKRIEEPAAVSTPTTPFFSSDEDESLVDSSRPNTPFFSEMEDDVVDVGATSVQRPSTPFFSDDEDDADIEIGELDSSKLGTLEEQKLQRMYRRAGAVTAEEQEKIRSEWEQFQSIEKQKRDISGLSDESSSLSESDLKYNITEVMKDGDFDAEKILSSIGPRPTRKRKRDADAPSSVSTSPDASSITAESTSTDTGDDILDPMFRSVAAVGGGRTKDDPEAKAKEKSAFEEFVMKQAQVRDTLDQIDTSLVNKTLDEALDELGFEKIEASSEDLDDKGYTDELMDAVGARPKRERKLTTTEYERVYSDNGGVSSEDEDDDDEVDTSSSDDDELMPPWMRKAKDGLDKEVSTDLVDDEEHKRKMQQLREYEQRRAPERPRQMGIDLSDVFGRDLAADNDYDYGQTSLGWERGRSFSGFESRKANLLDYTELDVRELNLLMDTKDSVETTGVSQYVPRINKPFKDFGAIFRMEGVLLDTTGFEFDAWTQTAKEHGYKQPMLEDVKLASVTRPEIAARKIFLWSDDFLVCKQIAQTHQDSMKDVFGKWMRGKGISYVEPAPVEVQQEKEEVTTPVVTIGSEADTDKQLAAWTRTAERFGFVAPSLDEVLFASAIGADDAVMNSFKWTTDIDKASDVVKTYKRFLSGQDDEEFSAASEEDPMKATAAALEQTQRSRSSLSENDLLEIQYKAWLAVAEEHDLFAPTPDEALGAMVINDPAIVVKDGFAWTDDPSLIEEYVREYEESVRGQIRRLTGAPAETSTPSTAASSDGSTSDETKKSSGPTEEEVTEMKAYAWMTAAEEHGCDEPMVDDFYAALYADPEYAVKSVYQWTDDDAKAEAVAATYRKELDRLSEEYARENNLDVNPKKTEPQPKKVEKPKGPSSGELYQAAFEAWKQVAERRGFTPPSEDQVQFSMTVGPEDGVVSFQWTDDADERKKIVEEYLTRVRQTSAKLQGGFELGLAPKRQSATSRDEAPPPYSVIPGATKWLESLQDVEMPCGIISYLEKEQVDVLLDQTGLGRYFSVDKRVTGSNGYELEEQQMLGAALRVERRPDHCVVFDSSPESSVAAHDVDMKSVSVVGVYPMYELLNADTTARYLDELTAMNVRRLFGERVYDQPMVAAREDRPDVNKQTKTLTRFWEEGDRE